MDINMGQGAFEVWLDPWHIYRPKAKTERFQCSIYVVYFEPADGTSDLVSNPFCYSHTVPATAKFNILQMPLGKDAETLSSVSHLLVPSGWLNYFQFSFS